MYYLKKKKAAKASRKPDLIKKLDKEFSLFIRLRDSRAFGFKYFKCISCGKVKPFEMADCGHFFSRRHMATRFSELNCHAECSYCNRFRADHLIGYERNLIAKIGKQQFDMLAVQASQTRKWSDFELKLLIKKYHLLNNELNKH